MRRGRQWSRELFTEGYIAVVPEDHPLRGRTGVTAAELANEPFVFPVCCDTRTRFEALAERCGYRPDVKMETDNTDYLLGLVAVGTGITVLPGLFKGQAERLGLHAVPIAEESLRRTIVLAARTAGTGSRLYRSLDGDRPRETGVRAAVPGI
ncbi:LysR family transcriptional regulator substrate-binding protein [Paenibacillus sp. P25]|nr:LysR family transcriptional regulator substrate-binding protein [Paenibacillus sp. P25]